MSKYPEDEKVEPTQRAIAEGLGVTWSDYARRAEAGVRGGGTSWPSRWYLRLAWRPDDKRAAPDAPSSCDDGAGEAVDVAHNQAILASIPKTGPVSADDILTRTVAAHGREGMAVKFISPFAVATLGMRGWAPVFDEDGKPVTPDGYLVMCEKPIAAAEARAAYLAGEDEESEQLPEWSESGGPGDGDIVRMSWGIWLWRGVLALYRFTPGGGAKRCRGFELVTQRRGRDPNSVRLGFYNREA